MRGRKKNKPPQTLLSVQLSTCVLYVRCSVFVYLNDLRVPNVSSESNQVSVTLSWATPFRALRSKMAAPGSKTNSHSVAGWGGQEKKTSGIITTPTEEKKIKPMPRFFVPFRFSYHLPLSKMLTVSWTPKFCFVLGLFFFSVFSVWLFDCHVEVLLKLFPRLPGVTFGKRETNVLFM